MGRRAHWHTGAAARYLNGKFLSKYTSIFRKSWKETAQEVTMQCETGWSIVGCSLYSKFLLKFKHIEPRP